MKYRRRREGRTNYRKRLKYLLSKKPRLVVRKGNNQVICQVVQYKKDGDVVIASANSHELKKFGWLGHPGNVSSSYLTGLLCGRRALKKKIKEVILDANFVSESILAAAKGFSDSGCKIPFNAKLEERRIQGFHIQDYAKELKSKDVKEFNRQFSNYISKGFDPTKFVELFNEVKKKIGGI